ncbi:MAG TPA: UDP-3-O-(3-hydroxymyristoyl)glucosamine N-acyltransferase [Ureibacillus sp.]|nr:UDP-3-O-(3-hydroxymyristoyl)glucosamine N-acyltransferase [Ureibacillus sp.]
MVYVKQILEFLSEKDIPHSYIGNEYLLVEGFSKIEEVSPNFISWIKSEEKIELLVDRIIDDAVIVSNPFDISDFEHASFIFCEKPRDVFFAILNQFFYNETYDEWISPSAVVETKKIGKNVSIGHHCYIGPDVIISDNVRISNNSTIEGKVTIGRNCIIHSGVVIGTDGFGYFQSEDDTHMKVPHYGGVVIGENVEIGANTCIDRGTLGDTKIGNHVKINNLCHIAHNVEIDDNVMISALSAIAGSVHLMKNVNVAPSAVIRNQLTVGENSFVGMGSVVVRDVPDNVVIAGVPAKIIKKLEVAL